MTDQTHFFGDGHDHGEPPGIESTTATCSVCGQSVHADLAGPEHDEPSDHEAVADER